MGLLINLAAVNRRWLFDFRGKGGRICTQPVPTRSGGVTVQLVRSCWCQKEKQGGITIKLIIPSA